MAVIYNDSSAAFSTNPFKVVAASALDVNCAYTAYTACNTERLMAFTPSAAADCAEVLICLNVTSNTAAASVTVELQKKITGSWVTQASKTLTYQQVIGTHGADMTTGGMCWQVFTFDTGTYPVALTTDADTWRLRVLSTTSACRLRNHRTSGYCYVVPVATAATYSATDSVVIKPDITLTVDQTVTLADVVYGTNSQFGNTNPAASYTWTVTGYQYRSCNSVFNAGSTANPVSYANQLTLAFTYAWAVVFEWDGLTCHEDNIVGAHGTDYYSTITSTAAASQKEVLVDDDRTASWQNGDTVWVWGARACEEKVIDTVSATKIVLTTNLSYAHGADWYVLNKTRAEECFGVKSTGVIGGSHGATNTASGNATPAAIVNVSGLWLAGTGAQGYTSYSYTQTTLTVPTLIEPYLVEHVYSSSAGGIGIGGNAQIRSELAGSIYRYWFRRYQPGGQNVLNVNDATISNMALDGYVNNFASSGANNTFIDVQVVTQWSAAGYGAFTPTQTSSTFTSCKFGYCYNAMYTGAMFNNTFTSCSFDAATSGGGINYANHSIGNRYNSCTFGSESANAYDLYATTYFVQDVFDSCTFSSTNTVYGTTIDSCLDGSFLKLATYNSANNHKVYFKYGVLQSTGNGLADTTVHTSGTGKFALRYLPSSSTYNLDDWVQTIPTGNIQNKTMTVAVWCKINNAAYYAGTHQLPRLTINYDNGTTAYAQAAQSTSWQLLFVTFTPTTTYGSITATLSGRTDATTTNAYIYWDDWSILYPASVALDLGGMDNWADALPVSPTIAIPISAYTVSNAVWEELLSSHTTANTFGSRVGKVLGWLRSLL